MYLSDLIRSHGFPNSNDIFVKGISLDAQNVQPGYIYVHLVSELTDESITTINTALKNGAEIVLCDKRLKSKIIENKPIIFTDSPLRLLSEISSLYYPNNIEQIVGVTGTCGKTSTVGFLRQMLVHMGVNCASIGSLGTWHKEKEVDYIPRIQTSPSPLLLHSIMNYLSHCQVKALAMEITSHGLERYRVEDVKFSVGVFINLSVSHLDFHGTFDNYFRAKKRFFEEILRNDSVAIYSQEEPWSGDLKKICITRKIPQIIIGRDVKLTHSFIDGSKTRVSAEIFGESYEFTIPFISTYQTENILYAISVLLALGYSLNEVLTSIEYVYPTAGRMELVGKLKNGAEIYLDYAHRPETFYKLLKPLHNLNKRTTLVFGSGGGENNETRAQLAHYAQIYANKVIVTDDNARDENPAQIRRMILKGCPKAVEIEDRRLAIHTAVKSLGPNDVCIIAGRGTETIQIIGNKRIELSDKIEILNALNDINKAGRIQS